MKESRFPAPAYGERRLRSTTCHMRTTPLVPLASLDLPNRGRRVACGSSEAGIPVPDEFYELVDEFILQANHLNEQLPRSRISAALMYAAARYNTHNWLYRDVDLEQSREEAVDWYAAQYRGMFLDNVQQLIAAREEHERDH